MTKSIMKFGPEEIMFIVSRALRKLKERSEVEQLGLQGLRIHGQLMTVPHAGNIVKLTSEQLPWVKELKLEQVGSHRYP